MRGKDKYAGGKMRAENLQKPSVTLVRSGES